MDPLLLVGIDIGKSYHSVAAAQADEPFNHQGFGSYRPTVFDIPNTKSGKDKLLGFLSSAAKSQPAMVAIEQTGGWASPLDQQLMSAGHELMTIHPLRLARARELYGQPHKTDRQDAVFLLWLLKQHQLGLVPQAKLKRFHRVLPADPAAGELKQLTRHDFMLAKEATRIGNQLKQLASCYLPDLSPAFKNIASRSCLSLLANCPAVANWQTLSCHTLVAWFRQACQTRVRYKKAQQVKVMAAGFSDEAPLPAEIGLKIQQLSQLLLVIKKQRLVLNTRIKQLVNQSPPAKCLLTLPGCGLHLAATLMAELSPIDRFKSHHQVAMYAGLTQLRHESGGCRRSKTSALVNRRAKWAFRQLARSNAKYSPVSQAYLEKHLAKGKPLRKAILCLGRQLVKVVVALIKTEQPFNPDRL